MESTPATIAEYPNLCPLLLVTKLDLTVVSILNGRPGLHLPIGRGDTSTTHEIFCICQVLEKNGSIMGRQNVKPLCQTEYQAIRRYGLVEV